MAKLKPDPITKKDLIDYLDGYSDFAFEITVLKSLIDKGFQCEHGGTYEDSATKKPREFDIRATKRFGEKCFLRLAVECKNLKNNYPLLISCLPRRPEAAFHQIAFSVNPESYSFERPNGPYSVAMLPISKSIRIQNTESLYPSGQPVGKACDQVGRTTTGDLTGNDSDIFDKWAQALSSADDLTYNAATDGLERSQSGIAAAIVVPLVVVPNDRLWVAQYDNNGNRTRDPEPTDRCSYFVKRDYWHRGSNADTYTISHLEFVTFKGLLQFIDTLCGTDESTSRTFAEKRMLLIQESLHQF